jgi:hypothetical protein
MDFNKLRVAANKQKGIEPFEGILLALDPGETTGVACYSCTKEEAVLVHASQIKTWPLEKGVLTFQELVKQLSPAKVVFESYQVYEWKTDDHTWSQIPTVQVIGMIQTILIQHNIPYTTQTAQVAKGFCDDAKLKSWGYYQPGLRHARDAIRHATYYLLFGPKAP